MGAANWKDLLQAWPAEIPRRGVVVTTWGEQVPFEGFLSNEGFLIISRSTPDSLGARMLVVPFDSVAALKLTDVVKAKSFQSLGFAGTVSSRQSV